MKYTKEYIIEEYKKLKDNLREGPSLKVFFAETGIQKRHMEKAFGSNSFSKLVSECGDIPQKFLKPKSDIEGILLQWAQLARELKKLPTSADWAFKNLKPTTDGITRSHNLKWTDVPHKFLEYYSNNEEWSDIVSIIPKRSNKIQRNKNERIDGLTFDYSKFIPPIIDDLITLSFSEENSNEFEKTVNLAFEMLGFEVTDYGQGTGRNPDGVAKENQNRYAILIDSKARKDNYRIGTEDRKFIEYIKKFSDSLYKAGFQKTYFLIVSSSFDKLAASSIKNIRIETQVTTTFLTARLLLKLLSKKIQSPRLFDLKKFQELLIEDGEITEDKVDNFVHRLK